MSDSDRFYRDVERLRLELKAEYRLFAADSDEAFERARERFRSEVVPDGVDVDAVEVVSPVKTVGPDMEMPRYDVIVEASIDELERRRTTSED